VSVAAVHAYSCTRLAIAYHASAELSAGAYKLHTDGRSLGMDEHEDDLESTVDEGAAEERDSYPQTSDDLEGSEPTRDDNDDLNLDEDKSEL
jgi:hypothetical protein